MPVRRRRARRLHDGAARLAPAARLGGRRAPSSRSLGLAYTAFNPPSLDALRQRADRSAATQGRSLRSILLKTAVVEHGLRCGAVSVPTHKLIPDVRWILDLGESRRRRALRPVGGVASARRATAWRCSRSGARTCCAPASRSTPDAITQVPGARLPARSRPTATSPPTCAARPGVPSRAAEPALAFVAALAVGGAAGRRARAAPLGRQARAAVRLQRGRGLELRADGGRLLLPGDYNPHYFINPPAFSYLLHAVFAVWFGGGWPFGAGDESTPTRSTRPRCSCVARVTSAVLGTAARRRSSTRPARGSTTAASACSRRS